MTTYLFLEKLPASLPPRLHLLFINHSLSLFLKAYRRHLRFVQLELSSPLLLSMGWRRVAASRVQIKSGIESKSKDETNREAARNWPSLLSYTVDLGSRSFYATRRVVNLSGDILDHCTPHYIFVYVERDRAPTIFRCHNAISAFATACQ